MKTESAEDILRRLWFNRDTALTHETLVNEGAAIRYALDPPRMKFYPGCQGFPSHGLGVRPTITGDCLEFKAAGGHSSSLDRHQLRCLWSDLTDWLFGPPCDPGDSGSPALAYSLESLSTLDASLLLPFIAQRLRPKENPT